MKEATGELNTTVIVVIIVAMLVAFFYFTIWPALKNNMNQNSACAKARAIYVRTARRRILRTFLS